MEWFSDIPAALMELPARARSSLVGALQNKKPSTLFVISSAQTADHLMCIISERVEDIVVDNVALAQVRIVASSLLVKDLMRCVHRLEGHASYFRLETSANVDNSAAIWHRITRSQSSSLARAEGFEQHVQSIEYVVTVIHQFVGMHMEAVEDIQIALASQRPDELARAIVASCRQASSFQHAVSQSTSARDLIAQIDEAVRSSLSASPRRDLSDQMHAAGQLGQFWNQSGAGSSKQRLGSHDVRLTLQILERELLALGSMSGRLRRVTERELSQPWDIQRRPLRYTGLAGVTITSTRTALVHSRFLGGTGQLEDKMALYSDMVLAFISNNVVDPVLRFYAQIFTASPTPESAESVAIDRSYLKEMVIDFTEKNLSHVEGAKELARDGSMSAVMNLIMEQARHPLRNSFAGNLGQAFVLQVQKLKCDVEELMLKSKQTLRAQELNLALVALVPSLLIATALTYLISTASMQWRSRNTELIVSSAQTARFILGDIQSTLLMMESDGNLDPHDIDSVLCHVKRTGTVHVKICELEEITENRLIRAPPKVLSRFARDLNLLRSTSMTVACRRKQIDRILQCYEFLQGR